MTQENVEGTTGSPQTVSQNAAGEIGKRQRSSIAFPYMSLEDAVLLAKAVIGNVGHGPCSADQLAPWVKQSPTSSAFKGRVSAARMFGLVDTERWDALRLTELGRMILDPKREREARTKAFLAVPLYRALYDRFKGGIVPPAAALEREMVSLGVASTLTDRARPVFERSAEQAGFYESGKDRLVLPGIMPYEPEEEDGTQELNENVLGGGSGGGGTGGSGGGGQGNSAKGSLPQHPLVRGLFESLPADGQKWSAVELTDWLQMAALNLRFAYKVSGANVSVTLEKPASATNGSVD